MTEDLLIEKWLNEELTLVEMETFKKLEDYQLFVDIIDNSKYFKAESFSKVDDYKTFSNQLQTTIPVRKLNWVRPLMRMASVFVIGFAVYFFFFFNNLTEIQTANAEKTFIELPDRSTVDLNAMSYLSYSKGKWDSKREVTLKGEAYFKVSKGSTFDVITSQGRVSVLGTQFNVKQRKDYFEVKCYEGVVRVTSEKATKKLMAGDTYRIYGDSVTYDKTSDESPQWIENISTFESVPLIEVINELERQYNIKIIYESVNTDRLFTGGFVTNNLENALNSVTRPLDLTYKIENSNQVRLFSVD